MAIRLFWSFDLGGFGEKISCPNLRSIITLELGIILKLISLYTVVLTNYQLCMRTYISMVLLL